jgi:putative transposase
MVRATRNGASIYAVAERIRVAPSTVRFWVRRAENQRLDRVDWSDRLPGRREPVNKTSRDVEDLVVSLRRALKETSALGEYGAAAIRWELQRRRVRPLPSLRTIGRILERRGALDGRRRVRRPAPPRGWYLPEVAARRAELDSFDIVEGLVIRGGTHVEVLNGMSLHGGLPVSWPKGTITAKIVVKALLEHWRRHGLPAYVQFDNDTVFQGAHQHPDTIGRVTRLCLSLKLIPVFTPPQETGFQAAIENFNGRWQAKVWSRFAHDSRRALQSRSAKFINASRRRAAARIENAPPRRPFPKDWRLNLQAPPQGCIIFLRRTDAKGQATILGHVFPVDADWPHRLVRAEVHLTRKRIRFYALRRRDPAYQPLLKEVHYEFPQRCFHE